MTDATLQRAFRRRRLERNLALVPLGAAWLGLAYLKVGARAHSGVDDVTFFATLAGVVVLTIALIVFTKVRWRCPGCSASLWGKPSPTACPACGVRFTAD